MKFSEYFKVESQDARSTFSQHLETLHNPAREQRARTGLLLRVLYIFHPLVSTTFLGRLYPQETYHPFILQSCQTGSKNTANMIRSDQNLHQSQFRHRIPNFAGQLKVLYAQASYLSWQLSIEHVLLKVWSITQLKLFARDIFIMEHDNNKRYIEENTKHQITTANVI